jgi:ribosomal protein S18 acetylase RimI-like enzyme
MLFVENKAKGKCKRILLEVLTKNPAVGFYKKIGYNVTNEKKEKYIMEKIL